MGGPEHGLVGVARRWWPVPAVLATSIVVQKLFFESRYDVSGHASGHLSSATAPFGAVAFVAILLWTTPAGRRQLDVLVACVAWLVATVLVLVGNVRVVDALVDAGLGNAPTEGLPDVADHGLANLAPWLAVVAAVAMAGVFWRRRHVSRRLAIGAGFLSVVFPPWIIPGAGVLVLLVARGIAYERSWTVAATGIWPTTSQRSPLTSATRRHGPRPRRATSRRRAYLPVSTTRDSDRDR